MDVKEITSQIQFGEDRMFTLISDLGQAHAILRSPFDIRVYLYTSFSGLTEVVFQDDVTPVLIQRGQYRLCSVPFGAAPELHRARVCDLHHCSTK